MTREKSMHPAARNCASSSSCSLSQTPACCQSRRLHQQLTADPQPDSRGRSFQRIPVRSTNTMPESAVRSDTRSQPGYRNRLGLTGGSNSSISFRNSSSMIGFPLSSFQSLRPTGLTGSAQSWQPFRVHFEMASRRALIPLSMHRFGTHRTYDVRQAACSAGGGNDADQSGISCNMRDSSMGTGASCAKASPAFLSSSNKVRRNVSSPDPHFLRELLSAIARQDRIAFRQLYDATSPKLFGYLLRILNKRELAEDVLQESFVSIWKNAGTYQASLAAPLTWMTTIVRNKAFDALRRIEDTIEIDANRFADDGMQTILDSMESTMPMPNEALQLSDSARALAGCMSRLEGLHRQAIALAFFHDLSHSEVAGHLKLPVGTVKTWIRRGLERLRLCLSKLDTI